MEDTTTQKLLILLPGLGAVSTTLLAGLFSNRIKDTQLTGSLTQTHQMDDGKAGKLLWERLGMPSVKDLHFAAWDISPEDAYTSALKAGVLTKEDLEPVREHLEAIKPMKGVLYGDFVPLLDPTHAKEATTHRARIEALRADIRQAKENAGAARAVMVYCASTERYVAMQDVHKSLSAFEKALEEDHTSIPPSQLYAYAALMEGVPVANATPNGMLDAPALQELAVAKGVPIAGKDLKSGQTFMKTLIAPGLKSRLLGVRGWFSTNILGNKDGMVLSDPASFKNKENSKLESLNSIFEPEKYPSLYEDLQHLVRINYYPPRGDSKESWDNIDIFGWMGYPMQIKVNFLCRDSILAAPLVLDIALFLDLAKKKGHKGIQTWMSFYFKSPHTQQGGRALHDVLRQHDVMFKTLSEWI